VGYGLELAPNGLHQGQELGIQEEDPDRYFKPDQYNNPSNWKAHYDTTGPEILAQTEGRITHFVGTLGTTGTVVGVGRRLREANPEIEIVAVEPDGPLHGIEGLKHIASSIRPGIYDPSVHHRKIGVSTEAAYAMARRLAREEGMFVGLPPVPRCGQPCRWPETCGRGWWWPWRPTGETGI